MAANESSAECSAHPVARIERRNHTSARELAKSPWNALATTAGVLLSAGALAWGTRDAMPVGSDLAVYIEAARVVLQGGDIYAPSFGESLPVPLPFTYPPVAALLAVPLTWVPWMLCLVLWTLVSAVSVALLVVAASGSSLKFLSWPQSLVYFVVGALVGSVAPVADTVSLGQVSAILVCIVYFSAVAGGLTDNGGAGVGVMTAVKLTPGLHLVWLAAVGRWRSTARGVSVAFLMSVASAAALAGPTVVYFTTLIAKPERVGGRGSYADVSLTGAMSRFGIPVVVSLVLCLGVAILTIVWAVRLTSRGWVPEAVVLVGIGAVLITPIAWIHHAVWIVPGTFLYFATRPTPLRSTIWVMCLIPFVIRLPTIGSQLTGTAASVLLMSSTSVSLAAMFILLSRVGSGGRRDRQGRMTPTQPR